MLVKDCMTRHPVMVSPTTSAAEAQRIMAENRIRHLPVVGDGKRFLGLVTRQRLALKTDAIGSLNIWEISRYLSDLKVRQVMLKAPQVYTVTPDVSVERAAAIMSEHKIGCLPVLEDDVVVGIATQMDILRSFQEMLGLPYEGVRVTVRFPDQPGQFIRLMNVLAEHRWGVMGIGTFPSRRRPGFYDAVLKIPHVTPREVEAAFRTTPEHEIVDIRTEV